MEIIIFILAQCTNERIFCCTSLQKSEKKKIMLEINK